MTVSADPASTGIELGSQMRKGQKIKLLVMALLCLGSAIYGGWQYWINLPERYATFETYKAAVEIHNEVGAAANAGQTLSDEQIAAFEVAEATLNEHADDKPVQPSKYDRLINLWLWFVGGLVSIPFLVWPFWKHRNGGWVLRTDGSLRSPKKQIFSADQIVDIDMTTWRGLINPQASNKATWQASLVLKNGRKVVLDDYMWDGLNKIIARFAHKFHPNEWNANGEPIAEGLERLAEAAKASEEAPSAENDN